VIWKEDVALVLLVLGLITALRGHRAVGLTTAAASLVWFALVTRVILPHYSGTTAFYVSFFPELGRSPWAIIFNAVRHPSRIIGRFTSPSAVDYLFKMTAPYAFLPLAALLVLAMGVPQTVINLASVNDFTRKITFHYAALPLVALILATVEGIWLIARTSEQRRVLVGLVLAASLLATVLWGPSPIGKEYQRGWWARHDRRQATMEAAIALVPGNAAVSASYRLVPHLTHRKTVYDFPNPFKPANWGVHNENYPEASTAEWLVIDRKFLGPADRAIVDRLLADGEFHPLLDRDGIVVARRVARPLPLSGNA
jgi:uncharacterized membrane protein